MMAEESCDCDRFHYGEEILSAGEVSQEVEIIFVGRDYHSRERHGVDGRNGDEFGDCIGFESVIFGRARAVKVDFATCKTIFLRGQMTRYAIGRTSLYTTPDAELSGRAKFWRRSTL